MTALRHPPDYRHSASVGGRDHRSHQGQLPRIASPSPARPTAVILDIPGRGLLAGVTCFMVP
ncbi:MAG: hypothetical protein R3A10_13955 [Caldilineaceae bacterium]